METVQLVLVIEVFSPLAKALVNLAKKKYQKYGLLPKLHNNYYEVDTTGSGTRLYRKINDILLEPLEIDNKRTMDIIKGEVLIDVMVHELNIPTDSKALDLGGFTKKEIMSAREPYIINFDAIDYRSIDVKPGFESLFLFGIISYLGTRYFLDEKAAGKVDGQVDYDEKIILNDLQYSLDMFDQASGDKFAKLYNKKP